MYGLASLVTVTRIKNPALICGEQEKKCINQIHLYFLSPVSFLVK